MSARSSVLFVDDDADALQLLSKTFEQEFDVLTATSGEDALAILRAQQIGLLVTDQKMQGMSGTQLVEAARNEGIEITTILLSGRAETQDLIAAIKTGQVYRYLAKPWDREELRIAILQGLEESQLRRDKEDLLRQLRKRVEALSVIYEVSRQSASKPASYDAILDRVLAALPRVLPCDCAAALIALDADRPASLRVQCHRHLSDRALLWVKDSVLSAHQRYSGRALPEDQVMIRVQGMLQSEAAAPGSFPSQLTVFLTAGGKSVGTLSLFSRELGSYSAEDGRLLDVLANQTIDAVQTLRNTELGARRRMERMLESMVDGILLFNEQNEIVVVNSAARQMMELPGDGVPTLSQLDDMLGFRLSELTRRWAAGSNQVFREELALAGRAVYGTLAPVINARGKLEGILVVLRDITEEKRLEERKDEVVSIISHELRTPLTSISGALELVLNVLEGHVSEKQRHYLALAKDSTDKLNAVVDELLDLSKLAKGRLLMHFEHTSLEAIVQAALDKYSAALLEKEIRWSRPVPSSHLSLTVDPGRIGQVLNNLFANALKFAPPEGEVRIDFGTDEQIPGYVWLSFSNTGESIPEGDLERIFEKFEQARMARKPGRRGTGLGLAISRSIVEAHGGRIWAEPCTSGAQFVIVLPLEPPSHLLQSEGQTAEAKITHFARGNVLILEPRPTVAYLLKALLLQDLWRVSIAGSPKDAMALIVRRAPDVLVVNAEEAGRRLAEQVRADGQFERVRILGLAKHGEARDHFVLEPDAALEMPLQEQALRSAVEGLQTGMALQTHPAGDVGKSLHSKPFERELRRRLAASVPFAICYFQLQHLSAYRQRYGFAKAADLLRQTEDLLREVLQTFGTQGDYLDRLANEDFVFMTSDRTMDAVSERAIAAFDRIVPLYYQQGDHTRGERAEPPTITACAIGVLCGGASLSQAALARQVAELRARVRPAHGSVYVRGERELVVDQPVNVSK